MKKVISLILMLCLLVPAALAQMPVATDEPVYDPILGTWQPVSTFNAKGTKVSTAAEAELTMTLTFTANGRVTLHDGEAMRTAEWAWDEKPYDIDIMLAKIGGIFKRRYAMDEIADGDLRLNKVSRTVYKKEQQVEMTAKEFDLLQLLMENKGKALTKEFLFHEVWGSDSFSEQQTLTVHMKWLREKIEEEPGKPRKLLTVWGVGYKYV